MKEKLKWQTRDQTEAPTNALQALMESFTKSPKNFADDKFDSWIYGIIVGWDDDSYESLSKKHNWTKNQIKYNKLLHENYQKAWNLFMSSTQTKKNNINLKNKNNEMDKV